MKIANETSIPFHDRFLLEEVGDGEPYIINVTTVPDTAGIVVRGHSADGSIFQTDIVGKITGLELLLSRRELYVERLPGLQGYRIDQGARGRPLVKV